MNRLVFLILFLTHVFWASGQLINPGPDDLFRESEITEIRLTLSPADKTFLFSESNRYSETYVSSDVSFTNSQLLNEQVLNVGLRLRGNTARGHDKRSYKIDFREYGGEKFKSYKKLNLKPNVNDPTLIRELLTMHMYRLLDVPAPRVAPAILYLNEEYMGVYLIIEQIDDEFVDKRYGSEIGFLYKCAYSATLEDNGEIFNNGLYESKMNEEIDTRAEVDHFVEVLNNTSEEQFSEEVEKVFNVDQYIKQLAVEAITGHWDGYSYLCNNYYLYYNGLSGLVEFLPYDTDNTWGIDWVDRDWATRDLKSFNRSGHPRPLTSRILDVPEYRDSYYGYLNFLFSNYFKSDYLYPMFDQLENLLEPYVSVDTYFNNSFGFTSADFQNGFDYTANQQAKYGLRDFVETRRATGLEDIPKIILKADEVTSWNIYPNPSKEGVFHISSSGHLPNTVEIIDLKGSKIFVEVRRQLGGQMVVQGPELPGIYFLRLDETITRVVVE